MIILYIYLVVCLIWGCFAVYKNHQYPINPTNINHLVVFLINFILFPYCLYIALKNKKI
jgi:hypothetical protein